MSRMHRQKIALFRLPERRRYDAGHGGHGGHNGHDEHGGSDPSTSTAAMDAPLDVQTDQTPGMLWTTDVALRLTRAQGTGLNYLDRRADQVVGLSLYDFFRTKDPDFGPIAAHRNALVGQAMNFEFRQGERMFFGLAEPLFDGAGDLCGTIAN